MSKVDLYTLIHKAQRAHLFSLSSRIGRADLSDEKEFNSIEQESRDMIAHLREHSVSETTFIHPLFYEIGDQISVIEHEHDDLEKELNKLEHILDEKNWKDLYPELNRFIAAYLTHQEEEERMQIDILWKYFDDSRLADVMTAYKKSRTPEQHAANLKFLAFGISLPELARMLQGAK